MWHLKLQYREYVQGGDNPILYFPPVDITSTGQAVDALIVSTGPGGTLICTFCFNIASKYMSRVLVKTTVWPFVPC